MVLIRTVKVLKVVALALLLISCSGEVPDDASVVQRGNDFYELLKAKNFDGALDLYAPEFFQTRPREQWKQHLQKVQQQLGAVQSFELKRQQADLRYSGKFFIYEYSVIYTNEKSWETITFFVPVAGGEVKLFGHQIKAKGI